MNLAGRLRRTDAAAAGALWAATLLIFAPGATRLGFYYDDAPVLWWLPSADWGTLWSQMQGYVPGRNLHYLWQYGIYKLAGEPLEHLARLHVVQSGLDGAVVAAFYLLLRLVKLPAPAALLAAAGFAFWPTHGETHFWPYAAPQNLVSTLLVIAFAATTWLITWGLRSAWLWVADALAFCGALFTYDQTFVVLAALAAWRVWRAPRLALAHAPYAVAGAGFVWLKFRIPPGSAPVLTSDAGSLLLANIPETISATVGPLWWRRVTALFAMVTATDWLLAAVVATVLVAVAWRLERGAAVDADPWPVLAAAAALYAAAYLPIWVWHVSQRHHYLPSVALFAGGAALLTAVWNRARPAARVALAGLLGAAWFLLAAACRGESRYWEQSFTLKQQLFAELRAEMQQADILVLEDFPLLLGPAYFLAPPDAEYGAFLLADRPRTRRMAGDISGVPAPMAGTFLYTLAPLHGPAAIRYYATGRVLLVRYLGLADGKLRYVTNPPVTAPYQVLRSSYAPATGDFEFGGVSARREGNRLDLSLSVRARVAPGGALAALVSFSSGDGHFHRWSRPNRDGALNTLPLLLGGDGSYRLETTLRLEGLATAQRLRLELYEAAPDRDAHRLGSTEVDVRL